MKFYFVGIPNRNMSSKVPEKFLISYYHYTQDIRYKKNYLDNKKK